jgi:hypothetical protein
VKHSRSSESTKTIITGIPLAPTCTVMRVSCLISDGERRWRDPVKLSVKLSHIATWALLLLAPVEAFSQDRWYFYFSAGLSRPRYDESLQRLIDAEKQREAVSATAGHFDLPGIYYRAKPGLLIGAVLNATFEHFSRDWRYQESLAFQLYNGNFSFLVFPGEIPGQGFFLRIDGGYSHFLQIRETPQSPYRKLSTGLGAQIGLGYGFRSTEFSHLLLHINYFHNDFRDRFVEGIGFFLGFLL